MDVLTHFSVRLRTRMQDSWVDVKRISLCALKNSIRRLTFGNCRCL